MFSSLVFQLGANLHQNNFSDKNRYSKSEFPDLSGNIICTLFLYKQIAIV